MERDTEDSRACVACKKAFSPRRYWQRFCTADCRAAFYRTAKREGFREYVRKAMGK